ncbi:sigma-70 family RNA polymerase sigma factor [Uliginosibacterium paludis]|uniref:Sigma-70 family RNA polymerase sigma factor n=1 Tax=Uliginosibacterium paludis TaxID=1615952 RepID=A0ABV2CU28_9RHOO
MQLVSPVTRTVEGLYQQHHTWLQGWLHRKLGCSQLAADFAQDTFTRLLGGRMPDVLHEPRAYLTTLAKGLLVNWYRRRDLERACLEALAQLPEPVQPSAEERYMLFETLCEIDDMLADLPALVRQTFLMSQLEEMKYDEIADALGISLSTVKRYMREAFLRCLRVQP